MRRSIRNFLPPRSLFLRKNVFNGVLFATRARVVPNTIPPLLRYLDIAENLSRGGQKAFLERQDV
jgi:hypothetical protein